MSDPTKPPEPPVGSPFPSGPTSPQPGSPFPSGPSPGSPFPSGPSQNSYSDPYPGYVPELRQAAGWKWSPLIGITYNGFPVGLIVGIIILAVVFAGR